MRNDVDEVHVIDDYRPDTLLALADRIDGSHEDLHLIYRETELDEVWRWVDADIDQARAARAPTPTIEPLLAVKSEVMAIHDLVGVDGDTETAAQRLRSLAAEHVEPMRHDAKHTTAI